MVNDNVVHNSLIGVKCSLSRVDYTLKKLFQPSSNYFRYNFVNHITKDNGSKLLNSISTSSFGIKANNDFIIIKNLTK